MITFNISFPFDSWIDHCHNVCYHRITKIHKLKVRVPEKFRLFPELAELLN
jgi:hypothetical protein